MRVNLLSAALTALLLGAIAAPARPCRAQEAEMDPTVRAEGRRMFAEADAHVTGQRWAPAADAYQRLYDFMRLHRLPRAPVAQWNRGLALMRIAGREEEARQALQRFLDESAPLTEDADVRDWRSTAVEHIATLSARGSSGGAATSGEGAQPPSSERGARISPVGPIVLAGGALVAIVGSVLGGVALVNESDLREACGGGTDCPDTPMHRSAYDELRTLTTVTDVLLVVGAVTAVAGVVLTLTLTEGSSGTEAHAIRLGPGGVTLEGSF